MALNFKVFVYPDGSGQRGNTGYSDNAGRAQNIDFYVVIKAKVTAPKNQSPNKIQFLLRRGGETRYESGYLITDSRDADAPKNVTGGIEYTYRTFGQRAKTPRLNWNVTKLKGRWNISVQNQTSNTVQFKIDKRGQIVHVARAYAGVSKRYPARGKALFSYCFGFAAHVYARVGLKIRGDTSTMYKDATAADNGRGSLRFFSTLDFETKPASYHPAPSHVAILDGDQQIDNNNGVDGAGPTIRPRDTGVGSKYSSGPKRPPYSKTLPYSGQSVSLLQGLDNE